MCNITKQNLENAEHYGYEVQSIQLIEECSELVQAVCKHWRAVLGLGQPVAEHQKTVVLDTLIEEIADVEIMLEQIKYLLKLPEEDIQAVKLFKVQRSKGRILGRE